MASGRAHAGSSRAPVLVGSHPDRARHGAQPHQCSLPPGVRGPAGRSRVVHRHEPRRHRRAAPPRRRPRPPLGRPRRDPARTSRSRPPGARRSPTWPHTCTNRRCVVQSSRRCDSSAWITTSSSRSSQRDLGDAAHRDCAAWSRSRWRSSARPARGSCRECGSTHYFAAQITPRTSWRSVRAVTRASKRDGFVS